MGKKPRTDTRARTNKRTCLNGSNPPHQVNSKRDVVMKLSVFGTWTHTHTQGKTYTSFYAGCNKYVIIVMLVFQCLRSGTFTVQLQSLLDRRNGTKNRLAVHTTLYVRGCSKLVGKHPGHPRYLVPRWNDERYHARAITTSTHQHSGSCLHKSIPGRMHTSPAQHSCQKYTVSKKKRGPSSG